MLDFLLWHKRIDMHCAAGAALGCRCICASAVGQQQQQRVNQESPIPLHGLRLQSLAAGQCNELALWPRLTHPVLSLHFDKGTRAQWLTVLCVLISN